MAPLEPKISTAVATVTTSDILFTVPETLEIIRKLGNATSQTVIMAVYKIGLLTVCGIKKHE